MYAPQNGYAELKKKVLLAAADLFLEKGFTNATTREIAGKANVNVTAMNRCFGSKAGILEGLVGYVLESQFSTTREMMPGMTEDNILFYAAETTLQLYMAETSENIRDVYISAYSLPKTSELLRSAVAIKLADIFKECLPSLKAEDFYLREVASGGVMRAFMALPCGVWLTMEQKVASFLECAFKIYDVPTEKIAEAIEFVSKIDYETAVRKMIDNLLDRLK